MNGIAHTLLANSDAQAVNLALLMSALLFAGGVRRGNPLSASLKT